MSSIPFSTLAQKAHFVIDPSISKEAYLPLDLSVNNPEIAQVNASSSDEWEQFINEKLQANGKKIAFGGYLEKRNLYQRSSYFNNTENDRNIHLGIDFWIDAGTTVHAVLDGVIHSFQDNQNYGDYGPTIIVEHQFENTLFYSLYGHLSRASLDSIAVGQKVKSGEKIAELGKAEVNGDYAPHLHFQLIVDLEGKKGDYPGVCTSLERNKYIENCPDPALLLHL